MTADWNAPLSINVSCKNNRCRTRPVTVCDLRFELVKSFMVGTVAVQTISRVMSVIPDRSGAE